MQTKKTAANTPVVRDLHSAFGGTRESGIGREGGREGVMEYLETQYISVHW